MMRILPLPLRVRLTLWYSLVFATTLLTIGIASLWMVHRAVNELEKNELQQRVRSVRRFLEARPKNESPVQLHDAITAAYDVSHGNKWMQAIDEHGDWLYRSPHVTAVYPSLVLPQQAPKEGEYFSYVAEAVHVSALIEPITVNGRSYTVQTGLSLTKTLAVLSDFRVHILLFTVVGLVVSSLAGYFMSRKALTPIAAIAAEAQQINDRNLNKRMPELATRDELASLSNTLNQMLGRIEAGYRSVRSFTANAAHELRSPVALLRAEAEVALAFPRDAAYYRTTCEHLLESSERMTRLIDQLLALARADAGVEVLRFEPLNLPEVVEEAAAEWAKRFSESGIRFEPEIDTPEFWIEGDYLALKRLFGILLENAWRYTPAGRSVRLALRAPAGDGHASAAEVSVTDTGIGIQAHDQERIFERFYRAARPLHGDFAGTGLGLTMGAWIAERHKSKIEVESAAGKGSCFSVRFTGSQLAGQWLSRRVLALDEPRQPRPAVKLRDLPRR
jgi:heavy metal sensor kinase